MTEGRRDRTVWVAHPGAAHFIYELVAAVQALGFRTRFLTGFYYAGRGLLAAAVRVLPGKLRSAIERELNRRSFPRIDADDVRQHRVLELAYVATARLYPHRPDRAAAVMHWRNRRFDRTVARAVTATRPDIVIGFDTSALQTIRAAKFVGSIAVLDQMIGHIASGRAILAEEAARQPDWADSLHADAPEWLIKQCLAEAREADRVFVPSEYVRETMIAAGTDPARIDLLPFGVRIDRFRPSDQPRGDGRFRLLYVGQISQRKGLSYLLEAVRLLDASDVELVMVGGIVGQGRGLARHEGRFRHVRNVPHAEVAELFRSADLFVYPSLHEGSALAIFEAMASGLPVITTLNSGSMVRDGMDGHIVPIRDPQAIADRIAGLRADPALRVAMARSARQRAEDFTWDQHRKRLGALLDGLKIDQKSL